MTGIKYPETDRLLELYIFIGVSCGVLILAIVCMCPCTRDPIVHCLKHFCGVYTFDPASDRYQIDEDENEGTSRRERRYSQQGTESVYGKAVRRPIEDQPTAVTVMLVVNTLALAGCVALTGFSVYAATQGTLSTAVPFIGMGLAGVITACFGLFGSRQESEGANCMLLVYFFVVLCVLLGGTWTSIDYFVIEEGNTESYVESNWDVFRDTLPSDAYDATASTETQIEQAADYVDQYFLAGSIALLCIAGLFLVAAGGAAVIIHINTLTASFYTVEAYASVVLGMLGLVAGGYFIV